MNKVKALEETFRESACIGDVDTIQELLAKGINVNARHDINGWTALHWAAKRGHKTIVSLLLENGADKELLTCNGESPNALCNRSDILQLLEGSTDPAATIPVDDRPLPIIPNYLRHPPLNGKAELETSMISRKPLKNDKGGHQLQARPSSDNISPRCDELVLKVRIAHTSDPDFIEVELPRNELTYSRLLRTCCDELSVAPEQVFRLRKLPDTIVRKDKDVQRLTDFQAVEVVLASDSGKISGAANVYQSISQYKNQTILY